MSFATANAISALPALPPALLRFCIIRMRHAPLPVPRIQAFGPAADPGAVRWFRA
jgi:hypothetical protein